MTIELNNIKANDPNQIQIQFLENQQLSQDEMKEVILFQFQEI